MKRLLKMRVGTLFTLMFVIPFVTKYILIIWSDYISSSNDFWTKVVIGVPVMLLYFSWFYTVGRCLHAKKPSELKGTIVLFKICLFLSVFIILLATFFMNGIFSESHILDNFIRLEFYHFGIVVGAIMFGAVLLIYCFYFIAKSLVEVETQKVAPFNSFSKEILLIWATPYGIWLIQPRINKVFESEE